MLSNTMIERLNQQINMEHYSANLYLQMSAWCDHQGLSGSAAFLKQHAAEEIWWPGSSPTGSSSPTPP